MPNYYQLVEELQSQMASISSRISIPKQSYNPNLSIQSALLTGDRAVKSEQFGAFTSFHQDNDVFRGIKK
jgi:hypothetical protein